MSIPKNISNIGYAHMDRMFVNTQEPGNAERWYETGHFIAGLSFWVRKIRQVDGLLRQRTESLGSKVEGTAEPAQNTVEDYRFYNKIMTGVRGVAFLCGDELWMFRLKMLGGVVQFDNRIAMVTDLGYESPRQTAATEFSGWIDHFELFKVSNLNLRGTQLSYTVLEKLELDSFQQVKIGN